MNSSSQEFVNESPIVCVYIDNSEYFAMASSRFNNKNSSKDNKRQPDDLLSNSPNKRTQQLKNDNQIITRSRSRVITPVVNSNTTGVTGSSEIRSSSSSTAETRPSTPAPTDVVVIESPPNPGDKIIKSFSIPAKSSTSSKSSTPARSSVSRNKPSSRVTTPIDDNNFIQDEFDSDAYDNDDDDEPAITSNSKKGVAKEKQNDITQNESETLGEIVEMKVDRLVRGVVNIFVKDKELWGQLKDIVESAPAPVKITNPSINNVADSQQILDTKSSIDETQNHKDYLMECKCLFLRTRTPSKNIIQYMIQTVWPQFVLNTKNSNTLMSKTLNNFNSWRNALNNKLIALANDLVSQLDMNEMPSNSALTKFVDDAVVKNLLEFWISQLHPEFDQHESSFKALKIFVRKAVMIHLQHFFNGNDKHHYVTDVLDQVKSENMNKITKNIRVPSLCEKDIADSVQI